MKTDVILSNSADKVDLPKIEEYKQIQVWLGHSNYNTTANIYAHLDSSSMQQSVLQYLYTFYKE